MDKAPATINRYKVTFSSLYRYGKQRDKVNVNPAREVSQHKLNNAIIRFSSLMKRNGCEPSSRTRLTLVGRRMNSEKKGYSTASTNLTLP
jgi:hypothetical protein